MTPSQTPEIQFSRVCYEVDQLSILKDIHGEFYKGTITALVGPSGSGKTTLLKMCNGLISPTSGEISIVNKPINTYEPTVLRRNIGIVLQSAPIIQGTVFENIALSFTLQNKILSENDAISYLNDVGLDHTFLHRDAADLSGGQRQKMTIARTLMNRPNILLLDEITSALDPTSAQDIEQLILKINEKYDVTIIWITHNIDQAKRVSHFTWVLMEGELIGSGETKNIWNSKNERIQQFASGVH